MFRKVGLLIDRVVSFNGRTGAVTPASGDYAPADVGFSAYPLVIGTDVPHDTAAGVGAIGTDQKAAASGVASLNASSKVVQHSAWEGVASGVPTLNASSKVVERLSYEGAASGVATLDASSKLVQDAKTVGGKSPAAASGLATLDANTKLTRSQSPSFRGALVYINANQSIAASTTTAVDFDAADYDTDSFWSAASPSRLTVPSGVTRVRLVGGIAWTASFTEQSLALIVKAGSSIRGLPRSRGTGDSGGSQSVSSAVVSVSAGDYFELEVFQGNASAQSLASDLCWMSIEAVE